jgi:hypothetical protein
LLSIAGEGDPLCCAKRPDAWIRFHFTTDRRAWKPTVRQADENRDCRVDIDEDERQGYRELYLTPTRAGGRRPCLQAVRHVALSTTVDNSLRARSDTQVIDARRSWIIEQFAALIRKGTTPKGNEWVQAILDWFIVHGIFTIKKKSHKSSISAVCTHTILYQGLDVSTGYTDTLCTIATILGSLTTPMPRAFARFFGRSHPVVNRH